MGEDAADGLGRGRTVGEGRARTEAEGVGVGVAELAAVAATVGVARGAAVAVAAELGAAVAVAAGAAVEAGVADAAVVGAVCAGGTNFFGGALGGGVDSVRIFVRARSVAERSETEVQPLSTFTSVTRSFTRRGRKTLRTSLRSGTETWSSFPLILAVASVFRSRRRR